jgi:hypothetical protein
MHFSQEKLERDLTKAAGNVNEMVEEVLGMELNGYSKIKAGARPSGRPFFSLAEANFL